MLDSASHNGLSDPKWLEENAKPDATDVVGDTGNPLSSRPRRISNPLSGSRFLAALLT
jgi:hypothetical protein